MSSRRVLLLLLLAAAVRSGSSCTTLVAGKDATTDGSVMTAHSNDGGGDIIGNVHHVPAAEWPKGSVRPPGIPQVTHTFGYHTEGYAAINEYQVALAESTCPGIYVAHSRAKGGGALLNIVDLSQIALERAATAREAVTVMGELGVKYGFYGGGTFEGSAESLLVADTSEAFIFHILPDDTGASAVWVAQRVPDDHVGVVANTFTVREVTLGNTTDFLYSKSMVTLAEKEGWKQGTPLDFTRIFGKAEPGHKYYSGRRMWGAYHLLAPEHHLSPFYDSLVHDGPYPATLPVKDKVHLADFFRTMRYSYQGTQFDLTQGLASGPFGTPDRWAGGSAEATIVGGWERSIALYRTGVSYITQSRGWLPNPVGGVLWFGPHAAHTTCYVPFAVGMPHLPEPYTSSTGTLDRTKAFWVHRVLLNVAQIKYSYMIQDINDLQNKSETASAVLQTQLDAHYKTHRNMTYVTERYTANAEEVVKAFANLSDWLLQHYADGYCNGCGRGPHALGYPAWWLREVNYSQGPPPMPPPSPPTRDAALKHCIDACPVGDSYRECVKGCL